MFRLFKYLKPYWWQILILLIMTAGQVYATLQLPALMAHIVNDGIVTGNSGYIWNVGVQMVLLAIFAAICSFVTSLISAKVGAKFTRDIRADVFQKVLELDAANIKQYSTASLINRTTNDTSQVQQITMMMLSVMLLAPMFCIISLIMAIQTAPDMSYIIAIGVVAIIGSVILILVLVMPKFKVFQKMIDRVTLLTRENLTGLKVIRAFNNEKLEQQKFKKNNDKLTKLLIFIDRILELQNPLINIIFNGLTLLCTYVGISLLSKDFSYLGNMSAFAQYVTYVMLSFLMLSLFFVMLPRANVSAERIDEILDANSKVKWPFKTKGIPDKIPSLEFKNVDFYYNEADEKVLYDISFRAVAGETTAFIGSTGSGKSTLINLIPRFYEPTNGKILLNGLNLEDYEKNDLMSRIGLVPQRGILFSGTVRSNIKFGAPNATDDQVKTAAMVAQANDFIMQMPGGYSAHIAQSGANVSGGQKQRLAIARAICKNPDIFIFDDSFSALDMKTDAKLRGALKPITKDMVVLIVAQRVSTIKDADQIIVLNNGRVVGKGKHYELLKDCEVYQSIVKSQFSDAEYKKELERARR